MGTGGAARFGRHGGAERRPPCLPSRPGHACSGHSDRRRVQHRRVTLGKRGGVLAEVHYSSPSLGQLVLPLPRSPCASPSPAPHSPWSPGRASGSARWSAGCSPRPESVLNGLDGRPADAAQLRPPPPRRPSDGGTSRGIVRRPGSDRHGGRGCGCGCGRAAACCCLAPAVIHPRQGCSRRRRGRRSRGRARCGRARSHGHVHRGLARSAAETTAVAKGPMRWARRVLPDLPLLPVGAAAGGAVTCWRSSGRARRGRDGGLAAAVSPLRAPALPWRRPGRTPRRRPLAQPRRLARLAAATQPCHQATAPLPHHPQAGGSAWGLAAVTRGLLSRGRAAAAAAVTTSN